MAVCSAAPLLLTGCGSGADEPDAAAPTASAAAEAVASETPTPTPTPSPSPAFGPVMKTTVFDITTDDGYKATMTVRWHKQQIVERSAILEPCDAIIRSNETLSNGGATTSDRKVYYVATADVSMEFPETGGFSWPQEQKMPVSFSDGNENQYWDRAVTCYDGQDMNDAKTSLSSFAMSPEWSSTTVMWVRTAERTPKNPDGELDADPDGYEVSPTVGIGGKCDERGTKDDDPSLRCFARYGS